MRKKFREEWPEVYACRRRVSRLDDAFCTDAETALILCKTISG